jgi:hypothetical protein
VSRKEDVEKDKAAQNVINQVDSKVIQRPLASTGLTGDQIPADVLTFDDMDRIKSNVRMSEENVEAINLLNSLLEQAGMTSSGLAPIRGTMQTKTQALTNNAVSYVDFGPGVWHITDIVVLLQGGSGTITYRAYAYDATDGNPALELVFGSNTSSTLFNFNGDSQFDHFQNQFFGETINNGSRQLGLKPSGTFDAGTMTAYILCHRVR